MMQLATSTKLRSEAMNVVWSGTPWATMDLPTVGTVPVKDADYWVEGYLQNWAAWMRQGARPRGLPGKTNGITGYTIYTGDMDAAYDHVDGSTASITNAVIMGLAPAEQCALHCHYLDAVYRFPREDFDLVLVRARAGVKAGLTRRCVWLGS